MEYGISSNLLIYMLRATRIVSPFIGTPTDNISIEGQIIENEDCILYQLQQEIIKLKDKSKKTKLKIKKMNSFLINPLLYEYLPNELCDIILDYI